MPTSDADPIMTPRYGRPQITLQLGLESVTALSKEVKKLSKKNTRLSNVLDLHKRRPPVRGDPG